jgi:hypothetical protein
MCCFPKLSAAGNGPNAAPPTPDGIFLPTVSNRLYRFAKTNVRTGLKNPAGGRFQLNAIALPEILFPFYFR